MAAKRPSKKRPVWKRSDIIKVSTVARHEKQLDPMEVGAQIIYGWGKKRQNVWAEAAGETQAAYRARMRELLNALEYAGYEIRR